MVYSNLTGTTAKEFAVGHGKDTERKVVTTAAGAQITNKDGTLVPVEVGAPQKTTDAMQKGTADNTYASKAQGEKADTALQKLAIGTVQKGDDAQVTASTSGTTSTLNFVLPKGDPGTSGVDGERGTKWFYGTDIATDVTEDAFVGDTFVFIEDAVTRASVSSRRGDLLVCTVAGAPGIAEWEYRMNIIGPSGSIWYFGTGITGTSTTGTIFDDSRVSDAYVNDKYLNTDTSNVYSCVTPGDPWTAEWIYIGSIKGEKGDTGEKGATGNAGAAAGFGTPTASATALGEGASPTITVSSSGANTSKIFDFKFGIPKGATGTAAGFGTPTASATQLAEGASPTVSVTSSGGNTAKVFNFTFGIPKGDTGAQGATGNAGAAAGFGTPTASASALTAGSTPTVTITPSGPNTAKIFDFKFGIPSGAKGDTGAAAGFGTPTATATTLDAGSDATVSVTSSGSNTAKVFNFTFGIPKGAQGLKGDTGSAGAKGDTGAQGPTGAAAGFGTPTASVDTLGAGENATVSVSSSGANTAKIFNFKFGIPRGATGAQGATGNAGAAAGFGTPTASATQLAEGASPTVSVTSSGSNTAKVFNFEFGIPKGATGSQGATGNTGATGTRGSMWYSGTAITGTAAAGTIFSNSGITNALVNDKYLNTLTGNVYNCATPGAASVAKWIYIGSIKGAKGDTGSAGAKGDTGAAAGFGTPTATATTLDAGSDATVSVTSSGSNTAKVFNFTFGIPKGAQGLKGDTGSAGAKGDTGAQGPTGAAAGFGTPTASATPLAAGSAPTVRITPSGPNTAKIFNFTFGIPRGATGEKGATGNAGATGTRGSLWYSGTAITGTATAGTIFSGSGIASALTNDKYLNTSTGNVYNCTTAGAASVAKWQYIGSIKGAKGDTGVKGDTGAQGPTGAAAGFGTPTASATKLAATANPTVTITPSGSNTAKVFAFSFGIPQGAQGATGPNAVSASTTTSGFTNGYVLYNNNGKVGAMVAGNIHIDAVTSAEEVDDLPE